MLHLRLLEVLRQLGGLKDLQTSIDGHDSQRDTNLLRWEHLKCQPSGLLHLLADL